VWIISRHYSDDQRMGSLFARIGREIGDRVDVAVDMRQIFRKSPEESGALLRTCKSVLEGWYTTYMQVVYGGASGRDHGSAVELGKDGREQAGEALRPRLWCARPLMKIRPRLPRSDHLTVLEV